MKVVQPPNVQYIEEDLGTILQSQLKKGVGRPLPPPPPNYRLQYTGVPKSPLLSQFCNSYTGYSHIIILVLAHPSNLALLPPPCISTCMASSRSALVNWNEPFCLL